MQHTNPETPEKRDLFGPGWLDDHIDKTVAEMAQWPVQFRPQLTGWRAEVMRDFDWDAAADAENDKDSESRASGRLD